MKDIFIAFFDAAKERIKSPLIGTFIFSWLIFNWKPLSIFLFSKLSVEARIDIIVENFSNLNSNLFGPIILASAYMIITPSLSLVFDFLLKKVHFMRKGFKNEQIINDINLQIARAQKETELEQAKSDYREQADLNSQIKILKTQIEQEKESQINLNERINTLTNLRK